jgi:hypothetical protein
MRGIAALAAALCVSLGAAAQERPATGESKQESVRGNWLTRWLPFGRKTEDKKPAPQEERPSAVESARAVRDREHAALQRRMAVCLKLQEIASSTNDEALLRKVAELERQAWDTYVLRTSHLPGSAAFQSDEHTLGDRLGPSAGAGRGLPAPAARRGAGDQGIATRRE